MEDSAGCADLDAERLDICMTENEYREAYEKEHLKCADLASQIADQDARIKQLEWELGRIKNNPLWKFSKPARMCMHWVIRQKDRLKRCGTPKKAAEKIKNKLKEKKIRRRFGSRSFPSEEEAALQRAERFPRMVKISVLVPLWNNDPQYQREMLDSMMNQTYGNWELCLADGSDAEHAYIGDICREYAERSGGRILYRHLEKNGGIASNTNACYEMATGDYIGLYDQDDILHPSALYEYVKAINEQNADYIYCDEITFHNGSIDKMLTLHFKPDYAPDNLRANNYICHFSVFSRNLMDGAELFRTKFDGSQDHDMILRLTDKAEHIVHVPKVLYYWRSHPGSVASDISAKPYAVEAAKKAVSEHLERHGFANFHITSSRAFATIFRIQYEVLGTPKVSIIIPNKDHAEDLKRCVGSILERSTYGNYEILVVENNSASPEIRKYYQELVQNEKVRILDYQGRFNYSAVNNFAARQAGGEYLLLLNNDTEVITVNWIEEMLMYAQRPDVGAVGAMLYYPDQTIQHAGIVVGLGAHRTAGHVHYKQFWQNVGYMGRLCYAQDFSAVTGACLMVKKSLYDGLDGLDESFEISLNDVDFCLRLREKGLLNVWTPYAELYHYESASRGLDDEGEKAQRYERESEHFRMKWKKVLDAGDPYYNPNFSLDRSDFSLKVEG